MTVVYSDYLRILRAFVQNTEVRFDEKPDIPALMEAAQQHSTQGIVCQMLLQSPELADSPYRTGMKNLLKRNMIHFVYRSECAKALVRQLDAEGIDCILFKGILVKECYPVPELRSYGDIDLVIRPEDRKVCHELMLRSGYECTADWEPVYSYRRDTEFYEIHTDIMDVDVSGTAKTRTYFSRCWEYVRPCRFVSGPHLFEFTPEFHFIYLLSHIAKHIYSSGAGVRMYLDLAFFVRNGGEPLDWNFIEKDLQKLGLYDFAGTAMAAVEKWFGAESPIKGKRIPDEVLDSFTEFTLTGGTFGKNGRDSGALMLQRKDSGEKLSRFRTLLRYAFPSADELEGRYTYLKKRPWLLPAAWVHRLLVNLGSIGKFRRVSGEILHADKAEAEKMKKLRRGIGL